MILCGADVLEELPCEDPALTMEAEAGDTVWTDRIRSFRFRLRRCDDTEQSPVVYDWRCGCEVLWKRIVIGRLHTHPLRFQSDATDIRHFDVVHGLSRSLLLLFGDRDWIRHFLDRQMEENGIGDPSILKGAPIHTLRSVADDEH